MNERGAEERKPTPQELNARLRQLFDQLPPGFSFVIKGNPDLHDLQTVRSIGEQIAGKSADITRRREASEHSRMLQANLISLLELAIIPQACKESVREGFKKDYVRGVDKRNPEKSNTYWVLDVGHENSGGVFDRESAEILSSMGYKRAIEALGYSSNIQAAVLVENITEEVPDYIVNTARFAKRKLDVLVETRPRLSQWKQQHTDLFVKEPRLF